MGTANATAAFIYWGHLPHAPHRLLVHMALLSTDGPGTADLEPDLYYGTLATQAQAMGYSPDGKSTVRWLRELRAQLVDAGAIELERRGTKGRATVWRLHPLPARQPLPALPWLSGSSAT